MPFCVRDSYRQWTRRETMSACSFGLFEHALPASFLRPAQAILGSGPSHFVGKSNGDGPRLDLLFAKEPGFAGRQAGECQRKRHQIEKLAVLLLKIGARLVGHGPSPGIYKPATKVVAHRF